MSASRGYLNPEVLSRISGLGLRARYAVEGPLAGLHRSPLHGQSIEFADYREYVPGDDLRRLDWRVFARSGRHYIKRFEQESNLRGVLAVDASASMSYGRGPLSKFDYAATLAACLAALMVRQRDAPGLLRLDAGESPWLPPAATQLHLSKIVDALESCRPAGVAAPAAALNGLADKLPRRGVICLMSDMLTPLDAAFAALRRLRSRSHEVILFHVLDRDELELPFDGSIRFRDIEGAEEIPAEPWFFRRAYRRAMESFCADVETRCRSAGLDYLRLITDSDLGPALSHYLYRRNFLLSGATTSSRPARAVPGG